MWRWGGEGLSRLIKTIRASRPRAFDCLLATDYSEIAEDDKAKQAVDESVEIKG